MFREVADLRVPDPEQQVLGVVQEELEGYLKQVVRADACRLLFDMGVVADDEF